VELGVAKGKKLHDKRETSKARDWSRDKARLMRDKARRTVLLLPANGNADGINARTVLAVWNGPR